MLLTDAQLHEIREIIRDHHTAFVASVISPDAVAPEVLEKLKAKGLVDVKISSIEDAYLYGQIIAALDDTKGMTYDQFRNHIRKRPVPLTGIEKGAIDMAQHSAAQYAVGLGNKIEEVTGNIIYEADAELRARMRDEIRDATAENIAKRESVRKLKSNLGWATKDWARDWDRIAVTEKHSAMQRGQADHIAKRYGEDARVFVRPSPNACKHCLRLYMGPDGHPRIFKLSELEANGTNFGKKAADWLPILPSAHPWGQCQLNRMPAGWGFDEHSKLSPKGKGGIEYEDEADLSLALMQEDDLQKAFRLQGHTEFQGLPIAIENKPGSVRKWSSPDGEGGETRMKYAYGFIQRTRGMDGDEIDVFLGPDPRAPTVYVIHQQNPKTGIWDEDKCFLGFSNQKLAESAYREHYDRPDFMITTSPMSVDHFKRWIKITVPSEMFKAEVPTTRLVIPGELLEKSKYKKRWRGKDGKWRYEYDEPKKVVRGSVKLNDGYAGPIMPEMPMIEAEAVLQKQPIEHFVAFDGAGKMLFRVRGTRGEVKIKPDFVSRLKDAVFTHNHPENGCLSKEDINLGIKGDVKEIRAVPADGSGAFVMRRPESGWVPAKALIGKNSDFNRSLVISWNIGVKVATDRMTDRIVDAGGAPGDASHPSFSQEIFDGFVAEETFKSYNENICKKYGWKLEKEDPGEIRLGPIDAKEAAAIRRHRAAKFDDLGRKRGDPRPESRRDIRNRQLKLFKGQRFVIRHADPNAKSQEPVGPLLKAGPFIGPRGGKWQDPQRKIPWNPQRDRLKKIQLEFSFEAKAHGVDLGVYFASGSNHPGEILGFASIGMNVGVAAPSTTPAAEAALVSLAGTSTKVFVDSGAFGEVAFGPDGMFVKKLITPEEWTSRLDLYERLASALGKQLYAVAPDQVGNQPVTLERMRTYRERIQKIRKTGASILAPIQKGDLSMADFDRQVEKALGFSDFVRAIPMKKDATSVEELRAFMRERKPRRIHLLGMGPGAKIYSEVIKMIHEIAPGTSVTLDSVKITSAVQRPEKGPPRKLTAAQDRVRAKYNQAVFFESVSGLDYTDVIATPSQWAPPAVIEWGAKQIGAGGKSFRLDPDAYVAAHVIDNPKLDHVLDLMWHRHAAGFLEQVKGKAEGKMRLTGGKLTVAARKSGSIQEVFGKKGLIPTRDYRDVTAKARAHLQELKSSGAKADEVNRARQYLFDVGFTHAGHVYNALKTGELKQKQYDKLHGDVFGPLSDFNPNNTKWWPKDPDLKKARVAAMIGAEQSQAAARAPGPSSMANFAFEVPVKPRVSVVIPYDLMSIIDPQGRDERIKLDKKTFEVRGPFHKEPMSMVIPVGDGLDSDEVKRNRKRIDDMHRSNIGQKNQSPVAEETS